MGTFFAALSLLLSILQSLPNRSISAEVIGLDGRADAGVEIFLVDAKLRQTDRRMKRDVFAYHDSEIIQRCKTSASGKALLIWPSSVDPRRLWAVAVIGDRAVAQPVVGFLNSMSFLSLRPQRASIINLRATKRDGDPAAHARLRIFDFVQSCMSSNWDDLIQQLGPDGTLHVIRSLTSFDASPIRFRVSGHWSNTSFEIAPRPGRFDVEFQISDALETSAFHESLDRDLPWLGNPLGPNGG